MHTAIQLRTLLQRERDWEGTVTALAATLDSTEITPKGAVRLAMWLRQHETTLWWNFGVSIRFSRTGRQRLVHVSRAADSRFRHLSDSDSSM